MKKINVSDELADYIQEITEENEYNDEKRFICDTFEEVISANINSEMKNKISYVLYSYYRLLSIIKEGINQ